MRSSSMSRPLSFVTSDPVAMTMARASSVLVSPLSALTSTLPGARMRPVPRWLSILFFFRRKSTPCTLPLTPSSLKACILARSSVGWT